MSLHNDIKKFHAWEMSCLSLWAMLIATHRFLLALVDWSVSSLGVGGEHFCDLIPGLLDENVCR